MVLVALISLVLQASGEPAERPGVVPAERACVPLGADERLVVDMLEVPLSDVARLVSCALEKNLLLQPASLGDKRVSMIGTRPLGRRDLLALWRAVLAEHGLVEERHGAFEVIRPVSAQRP